MSSSHGGNLYAGEVDSGNRVPRLIQFVQTYCSFCGPVSEEKRKELTAFTESTDCIPLLRIEAHLFASILARKPAPTRALHGCGLHGRIHGGPVAGIAREYGFVRTFLGPPQSGSRWLCLHTFTYTKVHDALVV